MPDPVPLPEVQHLLDIVNQTVQHPLNIDLEPTSERKPIHSLASMNVAEDGFYDPQPLAVNTATLLGVNLLLLLIGNAARTLFRFKVSGVLLPILLWNIIV